MTELQPAVSRRDVIHGGAMVTAGVAVVAPTDAGNASESVSKRFETLATVHIEIDGVDHQLELQPRDTLREPLNLTGTKKGCNRGECLFSNSVPLCGRGRKSGGTPSYFLLGCTDRALYERLSWSDSSNARLSHRIHDPWSWKCLPVSMLSDRTRRSAASIAVAISGRRRNFISEISAD
jgi:hypothetical protein